MKKLLLASALALATSTSFATIVDLNAGPTKPNAGPTTVTNSGGAYTYNPVTLSLDAGTYSVSVAGTAGGGLYDAYSVSTPAPGNYTNAFWSVDTGSGVLTEGTAGTGNGRYDTAADAYAAYAALAPLTFTLASTTTVSFYVDDASPWYFGDDTGGVSLLVTQVPEPTTTSLVAAAMIGLGVVARRRSRPTK